MSPASSPRYITWKVDYPKKTITATVRLAFWARGEPAPDVTELGIIQHGIEWTWNGHRFKCFDVVFVVKARGVRSARDAKPDELTIELVRDKEPYRSHVTVENETAAANSDAPSARLVATDGRWFGMGASHWAHEFGHILGDDDGYVLDANGKAQPREGRTPDVMGVDIGAPVSAQTITRIIRRSGAIDESKIKCPLTLDTGPSDFLMLFVNFEQVKVHAWACDYDPPTDDPAQKPEAATFKGTVSTTAGMWSTTKVDDLFGARSLTSALAGQPVPGPTGMSKDVEFEMEVTNDGHLQIPFFSDRLHVIYDWGADGLPVARTPLSWGPMCSSAWFPGPPLVARFRHGAVECP